MKISSSLILLALFFAGDLNNWHNSKTNYNEPLETLTPDMSDYPMTFAVQGNKIVDENGNQVVFRGLNAHGVLDHYVTPDDWDFIPWSKAYFDTMAAWGATIVRLPIHPGIWKRLGEKKSFEILDQAITWCEQNRLYVIIDLHTVSWVETYETEAVYDKEAAEDYSVTKDEMKTFWIAMAKHYKHNNVVAFYELYNEPVYTGFTKDVSADEHSLRADWHTLKTLYESLIDAIRAVDASKPILLAGVHYAYILAFAEENPVLRDNIIYVTHVYPDANDHGVEWERAFGNVAEKYPVFATEIGFGTLEKPEDDYTGSGMYRRHLREYLGSKRISFTAWNFSWLWTPRLLKNNAYTTTESGTFFKTWLKDRR
jgi:aryl-phospho-beta-D-glucosidase BglC (GH1 family)